MGARQTVGQLLRALRRASPAKDTARPKKPFSSVQIELTNNCNYRCPSCPQAIWRNSTFAASPFDRPRGFMDFDLYQRIVDEVFAVANEINFSFFGEPMMHPRFLDCLDYLKRRPRGFRVVMNSNMSYATREIFEKLIEIEFTELRISLDAATAETYDIVRPGKFFVDLEGRGKQGDRFETICQKVDYWFARPDHQPSRHVFTVSSKNLHELAGYVGRWQDKLGDDDVILAKNVLTYGGKMRDPLVKPNACNIWSSRYLTIDWSGRLSPCNLDTNMELTIGRFGETPLDDVRSSDRFQELQRRSMERTITPCRTCVDGNNWSLNYVLRRNDVFDPDFARSYAEGVDEPERELENPRVSRGPTL
jgi:radical SAM protein with 4Fe4S-binding SPASM domain